MNIHYFQHVPFEGLGSIENWATSHGHTLSATRFYAHEHPPDPASVDWLIIMGGPMSVNDERTLSWLVEEKRFIAQAIAQDKTVLGICLGAQLIAGVLGAKVFPNTYKEIGWFPVERTPEAVRSAIGRVFPETTEVFHWHGETFDLPTGAVHLASSPACRNQAFTYKDRVLALQFHLETTLPAAQDLIRHAGHEIIEAAYIQQSQAMLADIAKFTRINILMQQVLNELANLNT